jgi:hypothetical protein
MAMWHARPSRCGRRQARRAAIELAALENPKVKAELDDWRSKPATASPA